MNFKKLLTLFLVFACFLGFVGCGKEEYTITYDLDGGTLSGTEVKSFEAGAKVELPSATKLGFSFVGWFEGETKVETVTDKNYALKAKWEARDFTISYDLAGGEFEGTEVKSFALNATVTLPSAKKTGFEFLGWFEGETKVTTVTNKDYELVAKWEELAAFTVTYDYDGGTGDLRTTLYEGETYVLTAPTKAGYAFLGWYEGETKVESITAKEVSLTAKWAKKLAGGEAGQIFDYKYADLDTRSSILAALERWLLNVGYSVPLYSSLSFTLYAERLTPLSQTYVPNMGFGAMYGSVSTGSCAGTEADPAYRTYTSATSKTLNAFMYADSADSDILALVADALWVIDFTQEVDGFTMYPSMAKTLAQPVDPETFAVVSDATDNTLSKAWKVTLREDLVFTDYQGNKVGDPIDADDFIYSYKQLLDPKQVNERADDCFFTSGFKVVGAEAYFKQTADAPVEWDTVGIKKISKYEFVFITESAYNSWDFHYYTSSFILGPVYETMYEAGKTTDANGVVTTTWGSVTGFSATDKIDTLVFTGPYLLNYFEGDVEYRLVKNPNYHKNEAIPYDYSFTQVVTKIVKDNNAAFELWEAGDLDVISIPSEKLEDFINNPGIKKAPGATVFRLNVNACTQEQLEEVFDLTEEDWKVNPLLSDVNFRTAMFYAIDRKDITSTICKSRNPELIYMNDAYVIMDGINETVYRGTKAGKSVLSGINEGDLDLLEESFGFSETRARDLYVKALTTLVTNGTISEGTEAEPVTIPLEIALFDGDEQTKLGEYLEQAWERIFNAQVVYPNIKLDVSIANCPNMDVYYAKQMVGTFDIGIGGISGSALDPLGYMDVFFDTTDGSATSNSLQLTWGVSTNEVGVLWNDMFWSYEALTQAANGPSFICQGDNALSAAYDDMQGNCLDFVDAAAAKFEKVGSAEHKAATEAINTAVTIAAGYEAAIGVVNGWAGSEAKGLEYVKEYFAEAADAGAKYCKELCQGDLDFIVSDPGKLINDYGYTQEQLDAAKVTLGAAVAENGGIDTICAAFKALSFTSLEEAVTEFSKAYTEMYAFYLW